MSQTLKCKIHSLNGAFADATIIKKIGDNQYLAEYHGLKCTAIYNPFAGCYYVDDIHGVIEKSQLQKLKDHSRER